MIKKLIKILIPILCVALSAAVVALTVSLSLRLENDIMPRQSVQQISQSASSANEFNDSYFLSHWSNTQNIDGNVIYYRFKTLNEYYGHLARYYVGVSEDSTTPVNLYNVKSLEVTLSGVTENMELHIVNHDSTNSANVFTTKKISNKATYSYTLTKFSSIRYFEIAFIRDCSLYEFYIKVNFDDGTSLDYALVNSSDLWDMTYNSVYNTGYNAGNSSGYDSGYNSGYGSGYRDGVVSGSTFYSKTGKSNVYYEGRNKQYYSLTDINFLLPAGEYSFVYRGYILPDTRLDLYSNNNLFASFFLNNLSYNDVVFSFITSSDLILSTISWVNRADLEYREETMEYYVAIMGSNSAIYNEGYDLGYTDGYSEGHGDGHSDGVDFGYKWGYNAGLEVSVGDLTGIDAIGSIANGVFSMLGTDIFGFFSLADLLFVGATFMIFRFAMKVMT